MLKQITTLVLLVLTQALHLMEATPFDYSAVKTQPIFYQDNLAQSNKNYYFGSNPTQTSADYYRWVNQSSMLANQTKVCPPSFPYVSYPSQSTRSANLIVYMSPWQFYCLRCFPINNGINSLFNLQTRQCEPCRVNATAICNLLLEADLPQTNTTTQADIDKQKQVLDLCPAQTPKYNPDTRTCEACPPNQQFSGQIQSCVPLVFTTNLNAQRVIMSAPNTLELQQRTIQIDNPTQLVRQCPIETPYLKGKACVSCPQDKLFDLASQECVLCGEGQFYNANMFECQPGLLYFPDVTAPNYVSQKSNFAIWKASIDKASNASPRMVRCKPETPFVVDQKCISCEGNTPLFDIDKQKCVSCEKGRTYDSNLRMCSGSYVSGSLKLAVANAL